MLKGSRTAVVKKIQPLSVHGQISLDLHYVFTDDESEQVRVARIGPESVEAGLDVGDTVLLDFLVGAVTSVKRVP